MTRTRPTIQKRGGAEQCRPMWDATMRHPMAVYFLQQSTKFDCHRTTAVARTTKRHDQIEDGPGCGGWVNMNAIAARVLLFFAYGRRNNGLVRKYTSCGRDGCLSSARRIAGNFPR